MKSCIRIPRLFLPDEEYRKWAIPACDRHSGDRFYWERVAREAGDAPSALSCVVPDAFMGDEDEIRRAEARENMFRVLETGAITRLNRGCVVVSRTTGRGVRRGIVACVDLDEYSIEADRDYAIRATEEYLPDVALSRLQARRGALLEFPHTALLYRDKKDKLMRSLEDDLELLYRFEPIGGGGAVEGRFLPAYIAEDVIRELMSRADPCFAVADGNHSLAAAKLYWEEVQQRISAIERRNHPARFALVEFMNAADDAVFFEPVHRRLRETEDPEAFCDYFARNLKCKREGNVLFPVVGTQPESYCKVDAVIREFLKANGGRVEYLSGRPSALAREGVTVAIPAPEKEELLAAAKAGKRYPAKTFTLGEEDDARLCLEGREISYD